MLKGPKLFSYHRFRILDLVLKGPKLVSYDGYRVSDLVLKGPKLVSYDGYRVSLLTTDYLWSKGMKLCNIPVAVPGEIRQRGEKYGIDNDILSAFIEAPSPELGVKLLEGIVKYFNYVTFFISYSHNDKQFVEALEECIEQDQVRVWRDEKVLVPSDKISDRVRKGISTSDFFCLVLSENSIESDWVRLEYEYATDHFKNHCVPKILPILLDRVKLPVPLKDFLYADFTSGFDEGMEQFLKVLGGD